MFPRLLRASGWRTAIAIVFWLLPSAIGSPLSIRDDAEQTQSGSVPNIVSNFQDLSPVLSLLASDSVEDKIMSPGAAHWEHMSSVWSVFGLLGAIRSYLKICAGLAGAEAAGVDLCGAGMYTSKRTKRAEAAVAVGPRDKYRPILWWQDDRRRLLGAYRLGQAPWKRPHVIAVGQARCPFEGRRAVIEVVARTIVGAVTVLVSVAPTFILRPQQDTINSLYWPLALGMAAVAALLAGCILPPVLNGLNPAGVATLRDIPAARFGTMVHALQTADTVITSPTRHSSVIMWQNSQDEPWKRSGDSWSIRTLAFAAMLFLIGNYILTYILLGSVDTWRSYTWLGVQVAVLIVRYVLWSIRPRLIATRDRAILYLVTGSIVRAITADDELPYSPRSPEPAATSPPKLPREAVHFAVASACSRLLNEGGMIGRHSLDTLDRLSGVAPADILRAPYCDDELLRSLSSNKLASVEDIRVVRLPWSFMEELYAAQGLILGSNPWAFGGLYLAAVLRLRSEISDDITFLGLTTVAPVDAHTRAVVRGVPNEPGVDQKLQPPPTGAAGMTLGGICISSLVDGKVVSNGRPIDVEPELAKWHIRFRNNVAACRRAAAPNGPHHCEIHVQNKGDGPTGSSHNARTEPSLTEALKFVEIIVEKEKQKDHTACRDHCTIVAFSL